ncbi:MAG: MxaL protein [Methylophaga sp.]|nr:MAG: MxaL protein [Methylophaga sp.]
MKSIWILIIAALLLISAVLLPPLPFPSKHYNYFFIIDITRSMNVPDYLNAEGDPITRLDKIKFDVLSVIQQLPCGSRVGLGVFTERTPTMLYSPIEVCSDYSELRKSINSLDWRMAWVADSNIIMALYNSLELMHTVSLDNTTLVFFTDGHEAPPMNPNSNPDLAELQAGESEPVIKGIIIGTGDHALSRIPKYDQDGINVGYYTAEDVPQGIMTGLSVNHGVKTGIVPHNPRHVRRENKVDSTEHLSKLREDYLKTLAEQAKLHYHHLQSSDGLLSALTHQDFSEKHTQKTDLSYIPAALAFLFLVLAYLPDKLFRRQ